MSILAFAGQVFSYGKKRGFISLYRDTGVKFEHIDTKIIEECLQPIIHVHFCDIGIGYESLVAISQHHVFVIQIKDEVMEMYKQIFNLHDRIITSCKMYLGSLLTVSMDGNIKITKLQKGVFA